MRGYLGAYLRSGRFVEVQVAASDVEADKQVRSLVDSLVQRADRELSNVIQVSNVGFVSRDATFQARLPTLEVTLDPTARQLLSLVDVDTGEAITRPTSRSGLGVATDTSGVGTGAQIGAEVIRVYLEALFDAAEGLPAVQALNLGADGPTGLTLGDDSLPLFHSPTGHVDAGDLTKMNRFNDAVALKARIVVGRIVSGLGPLDLDNPPLENALTEIVATSVRKAAEKASWCWYACNLDVDTKQLERDAEKTLSDALTAEGKEVQSHLEADNRQVALRLRLHP